MQLHIPEQYTHLFEGLNSNQQQIVYQTEGKFAVLAGAGSGKTATLTRRTAYLLAQGIPAWQIMCVTFTNKAAKEMKARIKSLAGEAADDLWMGTFHSLCLRIIQRHKEKLGYPNMSIIDGDERRKIIQEIVPLISVGAEPILAEQKIEAWQNNMVEPESLLRDEPSDYANIYKEYQDRKKLSGYVDFNDILNLTIRLLVLDDTVRAYYQNQFRYVMCDEAQDVNNAQYELLNLFSAAYNNLALIGDDFQSIYAFRGANVHNMIHYSNQPDVTLLRLEQNYRSYANIIEASNALINKNKGQMEKTCFTENHAGERIIVYPAPDVSREADYVAKDVIKREVFEGKQKYGDYAVLYRNNRQAKDLEIALRQHRIPYKVHGNMSFFDRKEVKDIVGYLRAVDNALDFIAFERIINVPKRGIGAKAVERIQDYATDVGIPFQKALYHVADIPKMTKKAIEAVTEFVQVIDAIREHANNTEKRIVTSTIQMILDRTAFLAQFQVGKNKDEDKARVENIYQLMQMAKEWELDNESLESDTPVLTRFLLETSLLAQEDEDESNVVTLMSVHSSKGLEFHTVFIVGLEEGRFPSAFVSNEAELEEERRLMYVAMTRAERRLFLSYSKSGSGYRKKDEKPPRPSRFFNDIPRHLMYVVGVDS